MFSLTLIGLGLGFLVNYVVPGTAGFVLGIIIAVTGLIAGIIMATRVWKKTGTIQFLSRASATPELDKLEEDEHNDNQKK